MRVRRVGSSKRPEDARCIRQFDRQCAMPPSLRCAPYGLVQPLPAGRIQLRPLAPDLAHQQRGGKELHLIGLLRHQQHKRHLPRRVAALERRKPIIGLRLLGGVIGMVEGVQGCNHLLGRSHGQKCCGSGGGGGRL